MLKGVASNPFEPIVAIKITIGISKQPEIMAKVENALISHMCK